MALVIHCLCYIKYGVYNVRARVLVVSCRHSTVIVTRSAIFLLILTLVSRLRLKCDGTRAETRFRLSAKRTSPFKSAGASVQSTTGSQAVHISLQGFVLLVQACVLQSCDAYWLPTTFSCFPFTSPAVRHRVPSHFNWTLPNSVFKYELTFISRYVSFTS